jgi:LEA14-like dessication related protein
MKLFSLIKMVFVCLVFVTCKTSTPVFFEPVEPEIEQEVESPVTQFPQMNGASMEIQNIDSNRAVIIVSVNFDNPNSFEVQSPRIVYNYFLNRNSFVRGIIENETSLAPVSTTLVSFRMVVNYTDLFRSFPAFRNLNQVPTLIVLACEFDGEIKNWEINGVLPLRL